MKKENELILLCELLVIIILQMFTMHRIDQIAYDITIDRIDKEITTEELATEETTIEELTTEEITTEELTTEEITIEEVYITTESITTAVDNYILTKNENVLTASKGVNYNSDGYKETYYNLSMNRIVKIMREKGYSEEEYPYWIREDGVKMLGDYVMVAANLNAHPRGTLVNTSLGMGIVCDTGEAVSSNLMHLDIAVDW